MKASDLFVRCLEKEGIEYIFGVPGEEIWPTNPTRPKKRDPKAGDTFSDFTRSGKELMPDLIKQIYDGFNERNGTSVPMPKK